ncbi:MAG: hypothetical protein GC201_12755 [Alphaproteobacteria bacterium]|nr:hypothetical protein [Alphaproteobacteria bacterium]
MGSDRTRLEGEGHEARDGMARLQLYVAGGAEPSETARATLFQVLREMALDDLPLEIVDIIQTPERALRDQIFVTPTLIRRKDGARKVLIGDLRDVQVLRRFLAS